MEKTNNTNGTDPRPLPVPGKLYRLRLNPLGAKSTCTLCAYNSGNNPFSEFFIFDSDNEFLVCLPFREANHLHPIALTCGSKIHKSVRYQMFLTSSGKLVAWAQSPIGYIRVGIDNGYDSWLEEVEGDDVL